MVNGLKLYGINKTIPAAPADGQKDPWEIRNLK